MCGGTSHLFLPCMFTKMGGSGPISRSVSDTFLAFGPPGYFNKNSSLGLACSHFTSFIPLTIYRSLSIWFMELEVRAGLLMAPNTNKIGTIPLYRPNVECTANTAIFSYSFSHVFLLTSALIFSNAAHSGAWYRSSDPNAPAVSIGASSMVMPFTSTFPLNSDFRPYPVTWHLASPRLL